MKKFNFVTFIILLTLVLIMNTNVFANVIDSVIDIDNTHQTITGFGGSFAWWSDWLPEHKHSQEIYDLLFKDAGLSIVRLKNTYRYDLRFNPSSDLAIYEEAKRQAAERGEEIKVLMSSWSPASYLKSNNSIVGSDMATLKKDSDGNFMYKEFGEYWYELIKEYRDYGISIDYISIQNEPDWEVDYDGSLFEPRETENIAGYDQAFNAVYEEIQNLDNPPKMLGPESLSIDANRISRYVDAILEKNPESLYGIAHHLYQGGDVTNPDGLFRLNMERLNERYPDIPQWQTEYYEGTGLQTAWLIHNSLTVQDVEAYLHWDLVWTLPGSFIGLENPYLPSSWKYDRGYIVHERYYALKHFSKFIRPGYERVDVSFPSTRNNRIKVSAFASPDKDELVIVLINTGLSEESVKLDIGDFKIDNSEIYFSDARPILDGEDGRIADISNMFIDKGSLSSDNIVTMPMYSIKTIYISANN
ncbi:glycoside hydrolase [Natronospora cellulosivora (SeqCode)]